LGGLWSARTIPGRVTPVRDLTGAAREGLNFQAHCADLFHFGLPWNLGRIDRRLQPAPEAHCRYFVLHQRAEDRVLDVPVRRTETFKKELGCLAKVIDDDIECLLGNDIRHRDTNRLIIEIEQIDIDAEKKRITEEELSAARERREELAARIARCRSILDNSRQWIPFDAAPFRDALICSLELQGAGRLVENTDGDGRRVRTFPPLDRRPKRTRAGLPHWTRCAPGGSFRLADDESFNQPEMKLAISRHPELRSADMNTRRLYPRFAAARLEEALADTPVVLIHGPRQSGKTTLARMLGERLGYAYFSFDDRVLAAAAESDPMGFVGDLPERAILDEVQRVPEIFSALKAAVDRRRIPGRFLLTGSTNVLPVPRLAESLAGRMEIVPLYPLAQCELAGRASRFLQVLFAGAFKTFKADRLGSELAERVAAGGYPAALSRTAHRRRAAWYRDYIETLVQRDMRDLARIRSLDALPRLLALAAARTARLVNLSELSAPFQLSRQTIREYVTLLERVFLIEELPPWRISMPSRLVKTPKLHLGDTGLACVLLGHDAAALMKDRIVFGAVLETFVFQELRRLASWHEEPVRFHHFRDRDGFEVDIVMERRGREVAGIEVKASATVTPADFRGLRKLEATARDRFVAGAILYDGEVCAGFGSRLFAVPIRALWETT